MSELIFKISHWLIVCLFDATANQMSDKLTQTILKDVHI